MRKVVYIYIVVSIFAIVYLFWLWRNKKPEVIYQTHTEYVQVEVPKEVIKIKTKAVPVEKVVEVPKVELQKVEVLPDWLKSATDVIILAVGEVPPHSGKTRVLSLLNTKTGEGSLLFRQLPLQRPPFISFRKDLELRAGWDFLHQHPFGSLNFTFLNISVIEVGVEGGYINDLYAGIVFRWKF